MDPHSGNRTGDRQQRLAQPRVRHHLGRGRFFGLGGKDTWPAPRASTSSPVVRVTTP
jgi:hypothetical protein